MMNEAELLSKLVEMIGDHDFVPKLYQLVAAARAVVGGENIDPDGVSEVNTKLVGILREKLRYFEGEE